jgi:hypothetical protein
VVQLNKNLLCNPRDTAQFTKVSISHTPSTVPSVEIPLEKKIIILALMESSGAVTKLHCFHLDSNNTASEKFQVVTTQHNILPTDWGNSTSSGNIQKQQNWVSYCFMGMSILYSSLNFLIAMRTHLLKGFNYKNKF